MKKKSRNEKVGQGSKLDNSITLERLVFAIAILMSMTSCTREVAETSKLRMNLPKYLGKIGTAAADMPVMMAILNVRGPGIPGVLVQQWENPCSKMDGSSAAAATCDPSAFTPYLELQVPKGEGRLIQILAITSQASSTGGKGAMKFYYGDLGKSLVSDLEIASVEVSAIGSSLEEGNFSGRLIETGGSVRTGKIIQKFRPPGAKPAMEVSRSEIFGGWITRLFVLQGAFIDVFAEGETEPLIKGLSLDGIGSAGHPLNASPALVHVRMPLTYQWWSGSSSPGREQNPEFRFYGFLGAGVSNSSNKVCYKSTPAAIEGLYTTAAHATQIYWDPASTDITKIRVPAGGTGSPSDCTDTSSTFSIDESKFGNGSDGPLGLRGPFAYLTLAGVGSGFVVLDTTTTPDSLNWNYGPGVFSGLNPMVGVRVFYGVPTNSNGNQSYQKKGIEEGIDCAGLSAGAYPGYQSLGDYVGANQKSLNLPAAIDGNATNYKFVVCPFRENATSGDRRYFSSGVESYGTGGGGGGGTYLNITGPSNITVSTCNSYTVSRPNMVGGLTVNLADGALGGTFYSNATDCSGAVNPTNSVYLADALYGTVFFYKQNSIQSGSLSVSAAGYAGANFAIAIAAGGGPSLTIAGNPIPPVSTCETYTVTRSDVIASPLWVNLNDGSAGGQLFLYYADCVAHVSQIGGVNIPTSVSSATFYYKGATAGGMMNLNATASSHTDTTVGLNVGGAGPSISIVGPTNVFSNNCDTYVVTRSNTSGSITVALDDSSGGGQFYNSAACTTPIASVPISGGSVSNLYYYKRTGTGAITHNAVSGGYTDGRIFIWQNP